MPLRGRPQGLGAEEPRSGVDWVATALIPLALEAELHFVFQGRQEHLLRAPPGQLLDLSAHRLPGFILRLVILPLDARLILLE